MCAGGWGIHPQVTRALSSPLIFDHFSSFTHLEIKGQISAIKATMRTVFYQPLPQHGITILIRLLLCRMPVAAGGGGCTALLGSPEHSFKCIYTYPYTVQTCTYCGPSVCARANSRDVAHGLIPPSSEAGMRCV